MWYEGGITTLTFNGSHAEQSAVSVTMVDGREASLAFPVHKALQAPESASIPRTLAHFRGGLVELDQLCIIFWQVCPLGRTKSCRPSGKSGLRVRSWPTEAERGERRDGD